MKSKLLDRVLYHLICRLEVKVENWDRKLEDLSFKYSAKVHGEQPPGLLSKIAAESMRKRTNEINETLRYNDIIRFFDGGDKKP